MCAKLGNSPVTPYACVGKFKKRGRDDSQLFVNNC